MARKRKPPAREQAKRRPPRVKLRERDRRRAERLGYQFRQLEQQALMRSDSRAVDRPVTDQPIVVRPLAIYESPEEARRALETLRDHDLMRDHQRTSFSIGLAVGLSIVAVLGVGLVLVYALFRRRENREPQPVSGVPQVININGGALGSGVSTESMVQAISQALSSQRQDLRTFMRSYTLPSLTNPRSEAIRVATAGKQPYEVVIRCVEPPGGHAVLSFDPNELNMVGHLPSVSTASANFSAFPIGDVLVIPAGQFQPVRLRPGQVLYAKGTVAPNGSSGVKGVIISVTAADFVVGL